MQLVNTVLFVQNSVKHTESASRNEIVTQLRQTNKFTFRKLTFLLGSFLLPTTPFLILRKFCRTNNKRRKKNKWKCDILLVLVFKNRGSVRWSRNLITHWLILMSIVWSSGRRVWGPIWLVRFRSDYNCLNPKQCSRYKNPLRNEGHQGYELSAKVRGSQTKFAAFVFLQAIKF